MTGTDFNAFEDTPYTLPVFFLGHGSPMNAIDDNEFSRAWAEMGASISERPKAILCISAHFETTGTSITAMSDPMTLYDFYGFPEELYRVVYPAKGSPELADLVIKTVRSVTVRKDLNWGLDHGAWSVLLHMFPNADIPVVQMSLDRTKDARFHYDLGRKLMSLRKKGLLIIGSGNIVHNLSTINWQDAAYEWAVDFDESVKQLIESKNHDLLVCYEKIGPFYRQAIPTNEHYLPFLSCLSLQEPDEKITFFTEKVTLGSISMRSFKIGD
ncbi:MAG: 4,5-DOPA dioxygenase extradiol [Proteobacteria bacterium]|nr:4,5-DOPA dioxygenase extradiol [Pseudomonadota bacterium]